MQGPSSEGLFLHLALSRCSPFPSTPGANLLHILGPLKMRSGCHELFGLFRDTRPAPQKLRTGYSRSRPACLVHLLNVYLFQPQEVEFALHHSDTFTHILRKRDSFHGCELTASFSTRTTNWSSKVVEKIRSYMVAQNLNLMVWTPASPLPVGVVTIGTGARQIFILHAEGNPP